MGEWYIGVGDAERVWMSSGWMWGILPSPCSAALAQGLRQGQARAGRAGLSVDSRWHWDK